MKGRFATISLTAAVVFWPGWVFAAEGEPAGGSWFALIFYVINFVLFVWLVRRYGGPRIKQFFHDHAHSIREIRDHAEKAHQEAQGLAQRAAEQLRQLEAEQREMKSELDEETAYQVTQVIDAARDAVTRIRRDTEITAVALRDGAQRRLRQSLAEGAGRMARELMESSFRAFDQARLLRGFIDRIGEETHP
jgi:F-type H+-transporting ATPase subunit b